jgi:hypothetical protein
LAGAAGFLAFPDSGLGVGRGDVHPVDLGLELAGRSAVLAAAGRIRGILSGRHTGKKSLSLSRNNFPRIYPLAKIYE